MNRTYSGLSNPSPSTNNQSVLVVSSPAPDYLVYNTTYYSRVKVYDVWGTDSGWVSGASFTTPAHQYPDPDFNLSPSQPSELELVQFTDNSTCYDDVITGSPCSSPDESFKWTISKTTQGDPLISFLENPLATFSQPGNWDVTLEVTDNLGTCSITEPIKVNYPLPQWKEVSPR